jgi:peptidoglycan-N-acetylglucosamine deacetylase
MIRSLIALAALAIPAIISTTVQAQNSEATPATAAPVHQRLSYNHINVDGPYIALTFDDGPSAKTTPQLLDLLEKRGIKVTFFVQGMNAKDNPEIIKREIADGHEVGDHSWDHPDLAKKPDDVVRSQIQRTQDIVFQITGQKPKVLRPPYGAMTDHQKKWIHDEFGVNIIIWAVDPNDWKKPGSAVVAQRVVSETKPGDIILTHDIHQGTIDAVPAILDGLQAKGYKFVTVGQLIAMEKPKPSATPAATSAASPTAAATPAAPTAKKAKK